MRRPVGKAVGSRNAPVLYFDSLVFTRRVISASARKRWVTLSDGEAEMSASSLLGCVGS